MSGTPSPQRERSSRRRSKTADSALNKNRKSSAAADLRSTTPRSPFVPPTRATSVSTRHNKLYRCPPTPPPEVQYDRERSFVLDCKAVSNISNDYSTANPKLGSAIPPYVAQHDQSVDGYFEFFGVKNRLQQSGQVEENGKDFFSLQCGFFSQFSSGQIPSQLMDEFMIDFINRVMDIDIYHFEIDVVQVCHQKEKQTTKMDVYLFLRSARTFNRPSSWP